MSEWTLIVKDVCIETSDQSATYPEHKLGENPHRRSPSMWRSDEPPFLLPRRIVAKDSRKRGIATDQSRKRPLFFRLFPFCLRGHSGERKAEVKRAARQSQDRRRPLDSAVKEV